MVTVTVKRKKFSRLDLGGAPFSPVNPDPKSFAPQQSKLDPSRVDKTPRLPPSPAPLSSLQSVSRAGQQKSPVQIRDASEFIRAREKRTAQLAAAAGLEVPTPEIRRQATRDITAAGIGEPQRTVEEVNQAREAAKAELTSQGAFEEVKPQEVSLLDRQENQDLITPPAEEIPVLGPMLAAIGNLLISKGKLPENAPLTEETVRESALRQIREDSRKKGTSAGEKFGALVEAVPLVGDIVDKYARGLIETPSGNADEVIKNIKTIGEEASRGQEKVINGRQDSSFALARARQMEANVAQLEGRLQLLVAESAKLQANLDRVSTMQAEILAQKERIGFYRQAAIQARVAEIAGTKQVPTDEQILFDLLENK